ncbi:hypothetical protein ACFGVR_22660 [Mucilaginibacter sp. AW1-3]
MKSFLLFFTLTFFALNNTRAQGINFEKDSLSVVLTKAKAKDMPVMILLDAPATIKDPAQQQERNLLNDPEVVKAYQQNFICCKAGFGSTVAQKLAKEYNVGSYPTFLFLNSDGALVYRAYGYLSKPELYITTVSHVLEMIKNGNNIAAYQQRYLAGERSREFLHTYILAKEHIGFYDNSELINDYIQRLTIGEINTYKQMQFILQAGPIVGSTALQLSYMNKPLRDSIYKTQTKAANIAMNNHTIKNSFDKAIATKDKNLAYQASAYVQGTYGKDYVSGQRSSQSHMLTFYRATKDTTAYLQQAGYFYDRYYMNISVDSARRQQQKRTDSLKAVRERNAKNKDSANVKLVFTMLPAATNAVAQGLNTAAWETYLTGTHNPVYLVKAIGWVRHSIAIESAYYNHDTLAHLLYRYGFYAEAEAEQEQAVSLAKERKLPQTAVDGLIKAQQKIKQRSL